MPAMSGFVNFNPEKDIQPLNGKVIFTAQGTAGLGKASIQALVKRGASHIYFTGRNANAGEELITEMKKTNPSVGCNAGIMFKPPALSKDGYEATFATNHLAHALIIRKLLPTLLKTADIPDADVRMISLTSEGWNSHPKEGINFSTLQTTQNSAFGKLTRYGQSKLANVVYAAELARRYPQIMAISVHPGVVKTDLLNSLSLSEKALVYGGNFLMGVKLMEEEQGCLSQLWVAAGARKDQLVNGGFYRPVGVFSNSELDKIATSEEFANRLWTWTDDALAKVL
ncbi:putative short-chain dehydrogenase [Ustulina deusta]|nr:putative short-chain dehydrogenase [Ustulina deusta]